MFYDRLIRPLLISLLVTTFFSANQAPTQAEANAGSNILLICVDDLRPELKSFGRDYIHSPNIDRLANEGRPFFRHYVQAPTCGASRYTLLTGRYGPAGNDALFRRAQRMPPAGESKEPMSMPEYFRANGYTTVSVGKVSHHPGGWGGADWDNTEQIEMPGAWTRQFLPAGPWKHPRGWMHGLAHGEIRKNAKDMALFQALPGPDTIYPDGISINKALSELDLLADRDGGRPEAKPFFLAVGILRPHLPFGAPRKFLDLYQNTHLPAITNPEKPAHRTTWHRSGEFMKYNRWNRDPNADAAFATQVRKHYAACVSYADAQVGKLIAKLKSLQLYDKTIIVLWGDHGWHLGEHAIWGKHALFEEDLRSPLIIRHAGLAKPGRPSNSIVETLDIFPTLCELAGLAPPSQAHGQSLVPHLLNPKQPDHEAIAYTGRAKTLRTDQYRLIAHNDGYTELYDHEASEGETRNLAETKAALVTALKAKLESRLRLK